MPTLDDDDLFGEGVNEAERRRYFGDFLENSDEEDEEDMDYPEDSFFENRAESPPPRRRNAVLVNQHNVLIPGQLQIFELKSVFTYFSDVKTD